MLKKLLLSMLCCLCLITLCPSKVNAVTETSDAEIQMVENLKMTRTVTTSIGNVVVYVYYTYSSVTNKNTYKGTTYSASFSSSYPLAKVKSITMYTNALMETEISVGSTFSPSAGLYFCLVVTTGTTNITYNKQKISSSSN